MGFFVSLFVKRFIFTDFRVNFIKNHNNSALFCNKNIWLLKSLKGYYDSFFLFIQTEYISLLATGWRLVYFIVVFKNFQNFTSLIKFN